MARYLYEFIDGGSVRGVDFVEAKSVGEARLLIGEIVGQRQWRSGTLLDDDLTAALRQERRGLEDIAPEALARIEDGIRNGGGGWVVLREAVKANRWIIAFGAIAVAAGLGAGLPWLTALGAAVLLGLTIVFVVGRLRSRHYRELLKAGAIGDWPRVLKLARQLGGAAAKSPQLAFDLDARRGVALAATGHLSEAVTLINRWHLRDVQPKGIYWSRLAQVYHAGGDYGQFVACLRRSFAESRQAVWARIDFALAVARLGDEPREAVELLRHEDLEAQPEGTERFVLWARGMALLRLGDPVGAEAALSAAVRSFALQAGNPAVWSALALCTAALAAAMAENGRRDAARRMLVPVAPMVNVLADLPLAERLRAQRLASA